MCFATISYKSFYGFIHGFYTALTFMSCTEGRNTKIHGSKASYYNNLDESITLFAEINKKRVSRGYALIT